LTIRFERFDDLGQIRAVNEAAFERTDEADLVDNLRAEGAVLLSLIAEVDDRIAGHILFSRMTIGLVEAVALAPMAVLPEYHRRQIGSALVRRGLDELRNRAERIVIVLGHEHYYPRFGFSTDTARHLSSPFPKEAYMALELQSGALDGIAGHVEYPRAFGL
jgi:putative acetyltransferase